MARGYPSFPAGPPRSHRHSPRPGKYGSGCRSARRRRHLPRIIALYRPIARLRNTRREPKGSSMTTQPHASPTTAAPATRPLTGEEYIESLRDGREVFIYADKVADVTTHPAF